jgi:hypothetical protein
MTRDETKLGGANSERLLDVRVCLTRRLMVLYLVRAEASVEKMDYAAALELTGLDLKQIVRQGEQPEPSATQLAQSVGNLGVRWHGRELLDELFFICIAKLDALRVRQHLHHGRTDIGERNVTAGDSERGGILANQRRMAPLSPKIRSKVGSIV